MIFFKYYAQWVTRRPVLFLILAFFCSCSFIFLAKDVRFNNNFSVLFAVDNEANHYRAFYRQEFGADDGLLMAIIRPEKVDKAFFQQLERLTSLLEQQAFYQRVVSPVNSAVMRTSADDSEVLIDPLFYHYDDEALSITQKMQLLRQADTTAGRLVSTHSNTFAILAQMPIESDSYKKIQAPAAFFHDQVFHEFSDNAEVHFAGVAFSRIGILDLMHQDLFFLVPLTAVIVAIVSFILFRSFAVVLINGVTIIFSISATLGLIGLNNDDINQLTITFPVLLMVIVVANGIHFYHRYFRELDQGATVDEAVLISSEHVSKAAFLSCLTTAIGFFALLTADMPILRSFGFYLGCGVLMAFIGLSTIIPAALQLLKPVRYQTQDYAFLAYIDIMVAYLLKPFPRLVVMMTGVIFVVIGVFVAQSASYDYFLKDMLDDTHPQVISAQVADDYLSGAFAMEVSLLGQRDDFKRAEVLNKMLLLQRWLDEKGMGSHALSVAQIVKSLNKTISGENAIPDSDAGVAQVLLLAQSSSDDIVSQLVNFDYSHARIRINGPDRGAASLIRLQDEFEQYANALMADAGVKVTMTGEAPVAYQGMNRLAKELMRSVFVAIIFIVITVQIVFRDLRLAIASIFPNMLPIILGLVYYQFSGQSLNPLPGIAFCIAIGIAVDDTVHLFARFNEELAKGKGRHQAITSAVKEVKGALFSSSVILIAGFLVFTLSGFSWNRDLGYLGAVLIAMALVADLIYTPAFLSLTGSKKSLKPQQ